MGWNKLAIALLIAGCQSKAAPPRASEQLSGSGSGATRIAPPQVQAPPLPDPLPGQRKDVSAFVGAASRAAIGDLDGDGRRELVLVDPDRLRVVTPEGRELASTPVPGGIEVLLIADLDDDHRPAIIAGYGMSREHRDAGAQVVIYRLSGGQLRPEIVLAPKTPRAEIVEVVPVPEDKSALLIGYFESKYVVHSVIARRGSAGWTTSDVASIRMATSYARGDVDGDGKPDVIVGRVYGDDQGLDGDAFVLAPDGARAPIPTTRGVRSLAVADLDGDGQPEIVMADGWHQNYARSARGLLTWVHHTGGGYKSELIEDTAGQYSVGRIVIATIDGHPAVVTAGSHYVRVFTRVNEHWQGLTIAGAARDVAVGDLDGLPGDEILIVGAQAGVSARTAEAVGHSEIVRLGPSAR